MSTDQTSLRQAIREAAAIAKELLKDMFRESRDLYVANGWELDR